MSYKREASREHMPQTTVIRRAREADFDEVARIWHDSWETVGVTEAPRESVSMLRARIPENIAGGWTLFVDESGGAVRAMMAIVKSDGRLDQLFVDPPYHGQGIGSALLALAKQEMPKGIGLRTAQKNKWAIAFYERHRFVHERNVGPPEYRYPIVYYRWLPAA